MTFCQQSNHQIMTICCNPWKVQDDSIGIQIASILPFLAVTGYKLVFFKEFSCFGLVFSRKDTPPLKVTIEKKQFPSPLEDFFIYKIGFIKTPLEDHPSGCK